MKRFALALSAIVVGVVVSSCAVGVRQPATNIAATTATLNGKVLSTTGGPGSWYLEYGLTQARTERTPTRTIDFVVGQVEPVSEPVDGLKSATTYYVAVCAEDSENPGDPFCSPVQTFTTDPDLAADSVTGSAYQCESSSPPQPPCLTRDTIEVDARSGPAGEDPSGTITVIDGSGSRGATGFTGELSCLYVSGNVAVVGALGRRFGGVFEADNYPAAASFRVTDGGGSGSSQDRWEYFHRGGEFGGPPPSAPTDCRSFNPPSTSFLVNEAGDLVVADASSSS